MRFFTVVCLALFLHCGAHATAQIPIPDFNAWFIDQTQTLSSTEKKELESTLHQFNAGQGSQIAVLIVPTTQPETIEQFSIRLAEKWKVGRKKIDDGIIIVIAKNDRQIRLEIGYGLEGAIPDITAKRIIDEQMLPAFRANQYAQGIHAGLDVLMKRIRGEDLPTPSNPVAVKNAPVEHSFALGVFALFFVIPFCVRIFGRLFGSAVSGGIFALIAWFSLGSFILTIIVAIFGFIFSLIFGTSRMLSNGFVLGGGGFGGSSGGGFGGGGGGGFGGGGASGRW